MSNLAIFPAAINPQVARVQNSDGTNKVTIFTPGASGSIISSINISSTETAVARLFQVYITQSAIDYLLTSINIPVNSGFAATTIPIDLMRSTQFPSNSYDPNGNKVLFLKSGQLLKVALSTGSVTAGKFIDWCTQGVDY
jgi:hypothetical protein